MKQGIQKGLLGAFGLGLSMTGTYYANRKLSELFPETDNDPKPSLMYIPGCGFFPTPPPLLWSYKNEPKTGIKMETEHPQPEYTPTKCTFPKNI